MASCLRIDILWLITDSKGPMVKNLKYFIDYILHRASGLRIYNVWLITDSIGPLFYYVWLKKINFLFNSQIFEISTETSNNIQNGTSRKSGCVEFRWLPVYLLYMGKFTTYRYTYLSCLFTALLDVHKL